MAHKLSTPPPPPPHREHVRRTPPPKPSPKRVPTTSSPPPKSSPEYHGAPPRSPEHHGAGHPPPSSPPTKEHPAAEPKRHHGDGAATGPPPSSSPPNKAGTVTWRPRRAGPPSPPPSSITWQPRPLGLGTAPPTAPSAPSSAAAAFVASPGVLGRHRYAPARTGSHRHWSLDTLEAEKEQGARRHHPGGHQPGGGNSGSSSSQEHLITKVEPRPSSQLNAGRKKAATGGPLVLATSLHPETIHSFVLLIQCMASREAGETSWRILSSSFLRMKLTSSQGCPQPLRRMIHSSRLVATLITQQAREWLTTRQGSNEGKV
ncbi:formin-like protein 14 [Selaginella moellendorffii]|uniref:formin-like protein 14 n=1 Tax=Selaginella moellendorffii TaxID=88036 RepID=UPI000D1CCC65|nr:formin-like protein 14 [Selaginella moellendorffii]|eukprot:XP_024538700.1 formin-like protein 14 [Selaginella moellendorffii]